jgi:hypothetical protein
MTVAEALEWALDCLDAEDEVIGEPVPGEQASYELNGVKMGRSTQYADSKSVARAALRAAVSSTGDEVPDGTAEFVDFAVEYLVLSLGEEHPTVRVGRRIVAAIRLAAEPTGEEGAG